MNVLFLTAYPPVLNMHGGGVRMYHNIRILGGRHDVHVVSFVESDQERDRVHAISDICASVQCVRRTGVRGGRRWFGVPGQMLCFDTPEMRAVVDETCRNRSIDVLQCEYLEMTQFYRSDVLTVWTVTDLLSPGLREQFESREPAIDKARSFYRWKSMRNFENRAARRFDRIVALTPADAGSMRRRVPGADVREVPIGVDTRYYSPLQADAAGPLRFLFLGNFRHAPNLEAVGFIRDHLAPSFPDVVFEVAGADLPGETLRPSGIRYVGYQPDTRGLYRRPDTVVLAPLFSGRGQRVKLLEAFAMGVPVVTSPLGAAGFPIRHGREAFVAETPEEFRGALRSLCGSRALRESVGDAARRMIVEQFDWDVLADRYLEVVDPESAASRPPVKPVPGSRSGIDGTD